MTALAVFMPIVAGMGGNAATQTLTVIVRGLALGELSWANARRRWRRKRSIGLGNGLRWASSRPASPGRPRAIRCSACCSAWRWSATCSSRPRPGTLVPLGLKAMKIDPALASSVFITTFTDVVGFASFLGLATVFLRYLATG